MRNVPSGAFCQAELRGEFQTGGKFFCSSLYYSDQKDSYLVGCDILIVYSKLNQNILTMLFTCSERFKQIWGSFLGQQFCTRLRKRQGAKVGDRSTIRADWLCIGCPEFVGSRKEGNSNMGHFFCRSLYLVLAFSHDPPTDYQCGSIIALFPLAPSLFLSLPLSLPFFG